MRGIGLDVDFKGDFVIVDKAPFWISYILKHSAILTSEQLSARQKRTYYLFLALIIGTSTKTKQESVSQTNASYKCIMQKVKQPWKDSDI